MNDVEKQTGGSEVATLASPMENDYPDDVKKKNPEKTQLQNDDASYSHGKKGKTVVSLGPNEDPKSLPLARKWLIVLIMSSAALCTTCTSSIVRASL